MLCTKKGIIIILTYFDYAIYQKYCRQLLLSKILKNDFLVSSSPNSSMEEDYSADYSNKEADSESQEASDSPPIAFEPITEEYGDIDEQQFKAWLKEKDNLSENVAKVCKKYGSSLRKKVPMKEFMYDSEHDLLFCRNAKVCLTVYS